MAKIKKCDECIKNEEQIRLYEGRLNDAKVIYDDSIKTYRKALVDREYELIMRECEVVKEIDTLKKVINTLKDELVKRNVNVKIENNNVIVDEICTEKVKEKLKKNNDDTKSEGKVKEKVKEKLKKNSEDTKSEGKVKEKVKEKLNKTTETENKEVIEAKNTPSGVILPEINKLTTLSREELIKRGEYIVSSISNLEEVTSVVANKKITLYKKNALFFASMVLLVETTPKSRDSYSWSTVTNILRECEDYKQLVTSFTESTGLKLTYLNVRNWYLNLMVFIGDVKNNL